MFRRLKGKLRVEISLDDFSFIGKNGKKFLAGYISCTNLPLKKQTKRDNIYLFLMVKRPSTRIFEAMNQILKPFVDEMKLLEKNGITIMDNENGETTKIDVTLSKVVCDNLAQNEIQITDQEKVESKMANFLQLGPYQTAFPVAKKITYILNLWKMHQHQKY